MTNEQHIENLKKLKSFHNGSYGADIDRAIKALEQEPCDDCISRQVAIDVFKNAIGDKYPFICEPILATLSLIPSVIPKPKTGHWIDEFGGCECSECGCLEGGYSDYCPNCGAKMQEGEE